MPKHCTDILLLDLNDIMWFDSGNNPVIKFENCQKIAASKIVIVYLKIVALLVGTRDICDCFPILGPNTLKAS